MYKNDCFHLIIVVCISLFVAEKEHSEKKHSWDMWHGAKNLGKKLCAVSYTSIRTLNVESFSLTIIM